MMPDQSSPVDPTERSALAEALLACSPACYRRCDASAIELALEACSDHPVGDGVMDVVARDGSTITLLRIPALCDNGFPRRTTILMPDEEWILDPIIWELHFGLPGETPANEAFPSEAPIRNPSEERILITGNTYPVRDELKALGARWDGDARGWRVPASKAAEAKTLVAKAGPAKPLRRARWGRPRRGKASRPKKAPAASREVVIFDSEAKVGECLPLPSDPSIRVKVVGIETRQVYANAAIGWIPTQVRIAKPVRGYQRKSS